MWHKFLHIECVCEFASFSRMQRSALEEAIDRALATGRDLAGMILPWAQRPDHARRAHAVRVLADYHDHKRPKLRACACGAEYEIPLKRGNVPRKCPTCRVG